MDIENVLAEIRENREEIRKLHKEFYLFKGKAFGFLSILSVAVNFLVDFIKHKN